MRRRGFLVLAMLAGLALAAAAADTPPVTLKTTEFGRGPVVVLMHGLGSARMVWMPTAKKLLTGNRVVMVDLPGHGESPLPDPFSLEACAAALDQVLAKQKPDSTVLVAHGIAALVALYEVQAHPERVKGLMIIDGAPKSPVAIPEQQQQLFMNMLDTRYDDFLRGMTRSQAKDSVEANELYSQAQSMPAATMKAYLRAAFNVDASSAVKTMKPALLFVGSGRRWPAEKDWATMGKEMGYDDPAAVPARRLAEGGPLVMKQQPDSLAAVITEFTAQALAAKKK
jgi:pimeloyl-ACP methyl ester carboxylesterase